MPEPCPVCAAPELARVRARGDIAADLAVTIAFGHKLMQWEAADVYGCPRCGLLRRDPSAVRSDLVDRYAADEYGDTTLWRLLYAGRVQMRRDEQWLRASGLEAGRRIVEIGSYAGALLAVATRVGCRALGVDVGRETSSFARSRGHTVVTGTFDDQVTPRRSLDGVFVMNCFEQLPDPRVTLLDLRRALRRGGSLLIRTPNADVVRRARDPRDRAAAARAGVLGVPFVRCFTVDALERLLRDANFEPMAWRGRSAPWMDVRARAA